MTVEAMMRWLSDFHLSRQCHRVLQALSLMSPQQGKQFKLGDATSQGDSGRSECRDLRIGERYSARNVSAGSICATRSAGTKLAATAMTANSNGTAISVNGSYKLTPYN